MNIEPRQQALIGTLAAWPIAMQCLTKGVRPPAWWPAAPLWKAEARLFLLGLRHPPTSWPDGTEAVVWREMEGTTTYLSLCRQACEGNLDLRTLAAFCVGMKLPIGDIVDTVLDGDVTRYCRGLKGWNE